MDSTSKLVSPRSARDWEHYFDLRWRVLRAPWRQPRGSEKDDREEQSHHLMVTDDQSQVVAVGRLHFNSPAEAQVRFMAVAPEAQGRGFASAILQEFERLAWVAGARVIVLNARENVQRFYEKHGFVVIGPGPTMFDTVRHVQMRKELTPTRAAGA